MRNLLLFPFLCLALALAAQQAVPDFKYGISIANQTRIGWYDTPSSNGSPGPTGYSRQRKVNYLSAAPSFLWQTKLGNFAEVGIDQLTYDRSVFADLDEYQVLRLGNRIHGEVGLKMAYLHRFAKKSSSKWLILLGMEARPSMSGDRYNPALSGYFPTRTSSIGISGAMSPRLLWVPKQHLFLELGLGFTVFDARIYQYKYVDPQLTPSQQSTSIFAWNMLTGEYTLRVGAGIKF